jgi:hypothetical protein
MYMARQKLVSGDGPVAVTEYPPLQSIMSMGKENLLRSEAELKLDLVSTLCFYAARPATDNSGLTPGLYTGKEAKGGEEQRCRRSHITLRRTDRYKNTGELCLGCWERACRS